MGLKNVIKISALRKTHPEWFSRKNMRIFNDKKYWVKYSRSGAPFLVRETGAWTNMFGGLLNYHYRLNPIDPETLGIQPLRPEHFYSLEDVDAWLEIN